MAVQGTGRGDGRRGQAKTKMQTTRQGITENEAEKRSGRDGESKRGNGGKGKINTLS